MAKFAVIFITIICSVFYSEEQSIETVDIPSDGGECLSVHNALRALHSDTGPLIWNPTYATEAQAWAKVNANSLSMFHSTNEERPGQGENLYYSFKFPASKYTASTCRDAIIAWYTETHDYDWDNPGTAKPNTGKKDRIIQIGHFTALVWKDSRELGMGIATVKSGGGIYTYIVARYGPPGNVGGRYSSNVKALIKPYHLCANNPCGEGGTCIDEFISFKCKCNPSYKGKLCQEKLECKDTFSGCERFKKRICNNPRYRSYKLKCLKTCNVC